MKKYIFFLMGAVCFLLSSSAVHANELNKSDANIIGHVLDKNTEEHLSQHLQIPPECQKLNIIRFILHLSFSTRL